MVQEQQCQGSLYSTPILLVPPCLLKNTDEKSLTAVATLVQDRECDKDCWNSHEENRDEMTSSKDAKQFCWFGAFFSFFCFGGRESGGLWGFCFFVWLVGFF